MSDRVYECGGCTAEMHGYTMHELEKLGWVWHALADTAQKFILCDECEKQAARKRRPAVIPPISKHCVHCGDETLVLPPPDAVVGTPYRKALPTVLCRRCDKVPDLLRPVLYEPDAFDVPAAFAR